MKNIFCKTFIFPFISALIIGIPSVLETNKAFGKEPQCSNYWTNPQTGSRECPNVNNNSGNRQSAIPNYNSNVNLSLNTTESPNDYLILSRKIISCHNFAEICNDHQRHEALHFTIRVKNVSPDILYRRLTANLYLKNFDQPLTTLIFDAVDKNANYMLKPGQVAELETVLHTMYLPKGAKLRDLYLKH
jgi:hypothetical protein